MSRGDLTRRETREARAAHSKRNDFSAAVRAHVRERDGGRCVLCGRPGREVHHVLPRAQGGFGTADNGVCLDHPCHHEAHRNKQVEKRLLRFREQVLVPYYGLQNARGHVPDESIEQLLDAQQQGLLCLRPLKRS